MGAKVHLFDISVLHYILALTLEELHDMSKVTSTTYHFSLSKIKKKKSFFPNSVFNINQYDFVILHATIKSEIPLN